MSKINLSDFEAKLIYFALSIRKLHIYERVLFIFSPEGYIKLGKTTRKAAKNDVISLSPLKKILQRTNFQFSTQQYNTIFFKVNMSINNRFYTIINTSIHHFK